MNLRSCWILLALASIISTPVVSGAAQGDTYTASDREPIDSFILQRLRKEGLSPAPSANRSTLVRRAWLDVVRFAESDGFEYDLHRPEAWRYRDYVIAPLREDKPYDQFLREQLAGDEIDPNNQEMLSSYGFAI
jgi:hypothetical protein